MSEERPPHAVLLRSPEAFTVAALAAALGKRAGAPALDFINPARRGWGVAAESLPAAQAEALAGYLTAAGLTSLAVPSSLMEPVPEPAAANKAELSPEGFELLAGRGNVPPERLAWTRLAAVCAAALEVRSSITVTEKAQEEPAKKVVRLGLTLATGLPLMKGASATPRTVETRDRKLVLDLLFIEPSRRVRVEALDFDYSLLGARMGYGAELNFVALLEELCARAPRALRGRGTRALLARRGTSETQYESLDDLGREERWLFNLALLRAAL